MKRVPQEALPVPGEASPGLEGSRWIGVAAVSCPAVEQRLPGQARSTLPLRLIERGGPFPTPRTAPPSSTARVASRKEPRGYYREYTVETPGLSHRGARRIVTGGEPPEVFYYTDDHYDSFRVLEDRR